MSIKRLVAKTDHKQSGRLQGAGKRSITADTMVACDGHYSDPEKTIEEHSEKHTLEAELFAQLLDNTKMFCLIWTLI